MIKRIAFKSLLAALIASSLTSSALASTVAYNLSATSGSINFSGSFSFDTVTDAISNESLQSTGGPSENWTPKAQPFPYLGGSLSGWDLLFYSVSALFPSSPGDIAAFFFDSPLDGVSADGISGDLTFVYDYPPTALTEGDPQGCVTPGPACAATPLPATLPLFATGLGVIGLLLPRRTRKVPTAIAV